MARGSRTTKKNNAQKGNGMAWTKETLLDSFYRKKGKALKQEKSLLKIRMNRGDITHAEYLEILEETKEYYAQWKDYKEPKHVGDDKG